MSLFPRPRCLDLRQRQIALIFFGYINLQVATLCSKHTKMSKMRLDMLYMAIYDQFWLKAAQYTMFCVCNLRYHASLP
jgi:hypothetical protein